MSSLLLNQQSHHTHSLQSRSVCARVYGIASVSCIKLPQLLNCRCVGAPFTYHTAPHRTFSLLHHITPFHNYTSFHHITPSHNYTTPLHPIRIHRTEKSREEKMVFNPQCPDQTCIDRPNRIRQIVRV